MRYGNKEINATLKFVQGIRCWMCWTQKEIACEVQPTHAKCVKTYMLSNVQTKGWLAHVQDIDNCTLSLNALVVLQEHYILIWSATGRSKHEHPQ